LTFLPPPLPPSFPPSGNQELARLAPLAWWERAGAKMKRGECLDALAMAVEEGKEVRGEGGGEGGGEGSGEGRAIRGAWPSSCPRVERRPFQF
jgi:hypothetical protein